jgi:hypothetical protein
MIDPALPPSFAAEWEDMKRQIRALQTSSSLRSASIQDGRLRVLDGDGAETVRLGKMEDGSYGLNVTDGRLTVEGATVDAITSVRNSNSASNISLSTTHATLGCTLAVPTWSNKCLVIATVDFQMTTPVGTPQQQSFRVDIDGSPGAGFFVNGIPANDTGYTSQISTREVTSPGAVVTVTGYFGLTLGTNSANICRVNALMMAMRV